MEESVTSFKQKVYKHYEEILHEKIQALQQKLRDLIESTNNETKSSAGDKHETARAMLQIEQDNLRRQLANLLEQKSVFEKISSTSNSVVAGKGSLIKTNNGYLFISVALGKATVNNINVVALSHQSPLGLKLIGLKINEVAVVNGTEYLIEHLE